MQGNPYVWASSNVGKPSTIELKTNKSALSYHSPIFPTLPEMNPISYAKIHSHVVEIFSFSPLPNITKSQSRCFSFNFRNAFINKSNCIYAICLKQELLLFCEMMVLGCIDLSLLKHRIYCWLELYAVIRKVIVNQSFADSLNYNSIDISK